jgi:hypothetical protein
MRLKIRKLLKDGEYLVSFEILGFSARELKKMKKSNMPSVDLRSVGLGIYGLDQINLMFKCSDADEAEKKITIIKQLIREKLGDPLTRVDGHLKGKMVTSSSRRKTLILGLTCSLVLLAAIAYKGVVSSQQVFRQNEQVVGPVPTQSWKVDANKEGGATVFGIPEPLEKANLTIHDTDLDREEVSYASGKTSWGRTNPSGMISTEPDFTFQVAPETLVLYSEWGVEVAGTEKESNVQYFMIMMTPLAEFQGPVTLGISNTSALLKPYLYPQQINSLPGSSILFISISGETIPQTCSDITIIARGRSADGTLITHEKKLAVDIRQKSSYQGPVWHVSNQGSDQSGDGGYGSPFRTIQRAIDCVSSGDTVLVDKGLYQENINLLDKEGIVLASRFISDQDERTIKSTVIEAESPGWVVTIGRSEGITLCGFTIQGGRSEYGSLGGGIYCFHSNPLITNNLITKNKCCSGYGAGIYCYEAKPSIKYNHITENQNYQGFGGGIYCSGSESYIEHNVINDNYAGGGGSAIHLLEPKSAEIIRNVIYGGSGLSSLVLYSKGNSGDFHIINNTICYNQGDAIRFFGGIWNFENDIITENKGYGIFTLGGTAFLSYNNTWGNVHGTDTTNYYGLAPNPTGNKGNISADPCLGNPVHGNFHLCSNSPCINSGNPNHPALVEGGDRIDMGVFEYTYPDAICGDVNRDGYVDFGDIEYLADILAAKTPSPDPLEIGDVNCDDQIDKLDLGYLYESLYYFGPKPCSNCQPNEHLTGK